MLELFKNNAHGTIAAGGLTNVATTLNLNAGEGSRFPTPASGEFFRLDLENVGLTTFETVYCTARATDALTIVRARDGTSASAFAANDRARHRPTGPMLDALEGVVEAEAAVLFTGWAGPGSSLLSNWGGPSASGGGTVTNSGVASTNLQTSLPGLVNTATTTAQQCGQSFGSAQGRVWRGNGTNRGGFDYTFAYALVADLASTYSFNGIDSTNAAAYAPAGTSPGGRVTEQVGIGFEAGSAPGSNWQLYYANGASVTQVDTGFARNTSDVFLLNIKCAAGGSASIIVTLTRVNDGAVFTRTLTTGLTIPAQGTFLTARTNVAGAIGAAIKTLAIWRADVNQSEPTV